MSTTLEDGRILHDSFKKFLQENKEKVQVSIDGIYFDYDLATKLLKQPETFTKEDFIGIENEEQRRVCMDRAHEYIMPVMDFEEVQRDKYGILLKTQISEDEEYWCVQVWDSTDQRVYYLQVYESLEMSLRALDRHGAPEDMDWWTAEHEKAIWPASGQMESAHQGVAWTFYKSKEDYNPLIET